MSTSSFSHPAGPLDDTTHAAALTPAETAFAALGYAIQRGDSARVHELLAGDEFHHQLLARADYAGNTALHLAAMSSSGGAGHGAAALLRELLTRGASVHARNAANNTPLFLARRAGDLECVGVLEGAGGRLWVDERRASGVATPRGEAGPHSRPMSPGM